MTNEFLEWLENSKKSNGQYLSDSSAKKYNGALDTITNEMIDEGVINKRIREMNLEEFLRIEKIILNNPKFLLKDSVGNKMYSNALKKFKDFLRSSDKKTIKIEFIDWIRTNHPQHYKELFYDFSYVETVLIKERIVNKKISTLKAADYVKLLDRIFTDGKKDFVYLEKYKKCLVTYLEYLIEIDKR